MTASRLPLPGLEEALLDLGFKHRPRLRRYDRRALTLEVDGPWVVLSDTSAGDVAPLAGPLDEPGLWRRVGPNGSGSTTRAFEISFAMAADGSGGNGKARPRGDSRAWRELISWSLATSSGESLDEWTAPSSREVETWIGTEDLTVRVGDELVQGRVLRESNRLALEFPLCSAADLPSARQAWLDAVLLDAQRTWRLVRICADGAGRAHARVDLSGAPTHTLETTSRTALDALRWVTARVVPVATCIADSTLDSRMLEVAPHAGRLAEAIVP